MPAVDKAQNACGRSCTARIELLTPTPLSRLLKETESSRSGSSDEVKIRVGGKLLMIASDAK